jgi:hypothetical protein
MKRLLPVLALALITAEIDAQVGLQGIYIEKFYESVEADRKSSNYSGGLESGSITYRIYADLEPGYRFQAAFGSPDHALEITSTANFFNHGDAGTTHPNILPEKALRKDIAMLDSWLSVGAAAENHMAIPRRYDDDIADEQIRYQSGFLLNTTKESPWTLATRDGMKRRERLPFPTFYMVDSALQVLGSTTKGKRIYIENGAWACMGKGSVGVDSTSENHVLIAQLTTAGDLDLRLNIMIGTPDGKSIQYVCANPQDREVLHPGLICHVNRSTEKKRKKK